VASIQLLNASRNAVAFVRLVKTGRDPPNWAKHWSDASLTEFTVALRNPLGKKFRLVPGFWRAAFADDVYHVFHQSMRYPAGGKYKKSLLMTGQSPGFLYFLQTGLSPPTRACGLLYCGYTLSYFKSKKQVSLNK
jgi:hypothetical protein